MGRLRVRFAARVFPVSALIMSGLLLCAGIATAAAGPAAASVAIPQGSAPVPLSAGPPLGDTDPATVVNVSFILRSPDLRGLQIRVQTGWSGPYLSTPQFAARYGQSPAFILALQKYLQAFGITTYAYPDGLDVSATGTAGQFNKALSVRIQDYRVQVPDQNGHRGKHWKVVHSSRRNPSLPRTFASPILAVLGLSTYGSYASQALQAPAHRVNAGPSVDGLPAGYLAPQDFSNRYNLTPLVSRGAQGQGETIGIVTLAAIDPAVPLAFWNTYLGLNEPASRLALIPVDGGAPGPSADAGTVETDLDVEQSGAIAPRAAVRVYEAPNTDPGFADAFFAAASDNIADTVSVSWGESETYIQEAVAAGIETSAFAAVFDEVFAEFGAQGQSNFAATGDYGAYLPVSDSGTTNLGVGTPGASPYTTAAGGTTLPGLQTFAVTDSTGAAAGTESVTIPAERAWGWDYLWPLYAALGEPSEAAAATDPLYIGGDTGGYSVLEDRPSYQRDVSVFNDRPYLTPTDYAPAAPGLTLPTGFAFNPAPPLQSGYAGSGRAVPDLSTNADPYTGYAVYDPSLFASTGGFAQYGGTSFVAPQLNGATAVIDSALGHRVGFWNPTIYSLASGGHSPFTPLNDTTVFSGLPYLSQTAAAGVTTALPGEFTNDNLYYTGRPGAVWNPAAGLGTPDLTALAAGFRR